MFKLKEQKQLFFTEKDKGIVSNKKTYYYKNKKILVIVETKYFNIFYLLGTGTSLVWKELLKILKEYKLNLQELNDLCKWHILRKEI